MSGDPIDVLKTLTFIVELYCQVTVGAGLPVAVHVRLVVTPSAINVVGRIESALFSTTGPRNKK